MKRLLLLVVFISLSFFSKAQSPCDKIEVYNDEFRNTTSFSTPYVPDAVRNVWISKIKQGVKTEYFVHLREMEPVGKTVKGAFLILSNGKRISRPDAEIQLDIDKEEVSIFHPGYIQQADIKLTPNEILLLKSSPIAKYALSYLSDSYNGNDLFEMFKCLLLK